jgi:hypothetical protein
MWYFFLESYGLIGELLAEISFDNFLAWFQPAGLAL